MSLSLADKAMAALLASGGVGPDSIADLAYTAQSGTSVLTPTVAAKTVVFDQFLRSNRSTVDDVADSGQAYLVGGAGAIAANRLVCSNAAQAAYNQLNLGAPMRSMAGKFVLTPGTGAQGVALINTADATNSITLGIVGTNWIHLSISQVGWTFTWIALPGPVFTTIDNLTFAVPLARDGTVYGASIEIIGLRAYITVWNDTTGDIISVRRTPPDLHLASFLGPYCIWEPVGTDGIVGGSAFINLSAATTPSPLDPSSISRGEAERLLFAGLGDPLGIGYGTNIPPWVPVTPFAFGAANWGWTSKLLADSIPAAGHINFYVGVSSGNICVGVYRLSQGGALTRIATSGSVPCPAVGAASVALLAAVSGVRATDFLAMSVDNVTAQIYGTNGPAIPIATNSLPNGAGLIAAGFPLPAGPVGVGSVPYGPCPAMVLAT